MQKSYFQLDILVNNAGRSQRANWENIELNVDREIFELNVFSYLSLTRIAVKYFLENNLGQIVVISSLSGIFPAPYSASYTGSKYALHVSILRIVCYSIYFVFTLFICIFNFLFFL